MENLNWIDRLRTGQPRKTAQRPETEVSEETFAFGTDWSEQEDLEGSPGWALHFQGDGCDETDDWMYYPGPDYQAVKRLEWKAEGVRLLLRQMNRYLLIRPTGSRSKHDSLFLTQRLEEDWSSYPSLAGFVATELEAGRFGRCLIYTAD